MPSVPGFASYRAPIAVLAFAAPLLAAALTGGRDPFAAVALLLLGLISPDPAIALPFNPWLAARGSLSGLSIGLGWWALSYSRLLQPYLAHTRSTALWGCLILAPFYGPQQTETLLQVAGIIPCGNARMVYGTPSMCPGIESAPSGYPWLSPPSPSDNETAPEANI